MFSQLLTLTSLVLPFLSTVTAWDTDVADVVDKFNTAQIPSDIFITFSPNMIFDIAFPQSSGPSIDFNTGDTVLRNETVIPVTFAVNSTRRINPFTKFVIAMIDPDVPTPTNNTFGQFRHFLGANFIAMPPNRDGISTLKNVTPAITEYFQPTPPAGSPPHRYIFLLFEQPGDFNNQNVINSSSTQFFFNVSNFAEATHLGNPLAGAFAMIGPDADSLPFST